MKSYKFKYICKKCKAVHYYRPKKGCQNCGKLLLEKTINEDKKVNEESETLELNLEVDRLRLDEEWAKHPQEYHEWALAFADAQYEYDKAKSSLELTKAILDGDIRNNPGDFDLKEKFTEAVVTNTIIVQLEYQAAVKKLNAARYELEQRKADVNALDQRKRQLTVLAELWIRDYYSEATVKGQTDEGREFEKRTARERGRKRREREKEDELQELGD